MDPIALGVAFALGFAARKLGLPPLVGFLAAGFALHAVGIEPGKDIDRIADLGVQLLLFSIGLKLRLRTLGRPEIWELTCAQRSPLRVAMLTLTHKQEDLLASRHLLDEGYACLVVATAHFEDEVADLEAAGVHAAYNLYGEAGVGFAEHVSQQLTLGGRKVQN